MGNPFIKINNTKFPNISRYKLMVDRSKENSSSINCLLKTLAPTIISDHCEVVLDQLLPTKYFMKKNKGSKTYRAMEP